MKQKRVVEREYRRQLTDIPESFKPGDRFSAPLFTWQDEDGKVQGWPEYRLRRICADDPRSFERAFRMRAISDEERDFKSFDKMLRYGSSLHEVVPDNTPTWIGVDISGEKRAGSVALSAAHVDSVNWVREIRQWAGGPQATIDQLSKMALYYINRKCLRGVIVEDNAAQTYVAYALEQRNTGAPVFGLTTTYMKKMWALNLEVDLGQGRWGIAMEDPKPVMEFEGIHAKPTGQIVPLRMHDHEMCACPWCRFIQSAISYPASRETDPVMSWLMAAEGMRAGIGYSDVQEKWYLGGKEITPGVIDAFDPYGHEDIDIDRGWVRV